MRWLIFWAIFLAVDLVAFVAYVIYRITKGGQEAGRIEKD